MQWPQLGHVQVCTSLQTDNHYSTPPLSFLQAGCPSCRPTNSVKALKAKALKAEKCKSYINSHKIHKIDYNFNPQQLRCRQSKAVFSITIVSAGNKLEKSCTSSQNNCFLPVMSAACPVHATEYRRKCKETMMQVHIGLMQSRRTFLNLNGLSKKMWTFCVGR